MADQLPTAQHGHDISILLEISARMGAIEEHIRESKADRERLSDHITKEEADFFDNREGLSEVKRSIDLIHARLDEIPDRTHRKHHELIDQQIQREKDKHKLRLSIIEKLATGGAWSVILGFGGLILYALKHFIEDILSKGV